MAIIQESNFPNSRVSSSLLAVDVVSGDPIAISGEVVGLKKALSVQLASSGGIGADVNIAQIDGVTVANYNFANPMVPKSYDTMLPTYNPTSDVWKFYKGGLGGVLVATQTINYTDATKNVILNVVTV
jgi:hypothetical protein